MVHYFQFVDAISASPTVLLDLDTDNPFSVKPNSSVSPPGADEDSRDILLALRVKKVAAETQSTAIQTLARILDRRDGAWLKWQAEGMNKPRFFRTRPASFDVIDDVLDATPGRALNLKLSADPDAYGLPEVGSFTITNDPTSGTNKMMYAFGAIKGDVPTPLLLSFPTPDGVHRTLVASCADYLASAVASPYYMSLTAGTINGSPPAGWAVADAADGNMVAGNKRTLTKSSGVLLCRPTAAVVQQWASLPPGDYRVMVRTNAAPAGAEILFFNRPPSSGSELIRSEAVGKAVVSATTTGRDWHDLGVVAMPGGAPLSDIAFGQAGATGPALWNIAIYSALSAMAISLDCVVLVPAGRPGIRTRQGSVAFPSTYATRVVSWDGQNYRRFAIGESVHTAGVSSVLSPSEVTGGDPLVAPNASNVLHFFTTTADPAAASRVNDSRSATTVVDFKYFPRYRYDRPDTT